MEVLASPPPLLAAVPPARRIGNPAIWGSLPGFPVSRRNVSHTPSQVVPSWYISAPVRALCLTMRRHTASYSARRADTVRRCPTLRLGGYRYAPASCRCRVSPANRTTRTRVRRSWSSNLSRFSSEPAQIRQKLSATRRFRCWPAVPANAARTSLMRSLSLLSTMTTGAPVFRGTGAPRYAGALLNRQNTYVPRLIP